MDKLKRALEFVAPSTPTGFLVYGWIGAIVASWGSTVISAATGSWLLGFGLVVVVWTLLWFRAKKVREENRKLQEVVNEIHRVMVSGEEETSDGRTDSASAE